MREVFYVYPRVTSNYIGLMSIVLKSMFVTSQSTSRSLIAFRCGVICWSRDCPLFCHSLSACIVTIQWITGRNISVIVFIDHLCIYDRVSYGVVMK